MTKRNTIQRALVLQAVKQLRCHATADEVYNLLVKEHPHISRGTVYRNLNQLSESGEIRKIEIPGSADRFDHRCHNHYHLKCIRCGRVFDVEMAYMENLEAKVSDTHGFAFLGHELIFQGLCPACRKKATCLGQPGSSEP